MFISTYANSEPVLTVVRKDREIAPFEFDD